MILDPIIAVDRQSKQIACFDDYTMIKPYEPYADEKTAVAYAEVWFRDKTDRTPRLVYPMITRMTCSCRR